MDADGLTGANIRESSLARVPDAAKLGGVAARPVPQVVKTPVATDRDACRSGETGTFCSYEFSDEYSPRWEHWGGGHEAVRFYRDAFGVVHLEGVVREIDGAGGAATIFLLPVGRRPAARHVFSVIGSEQEGSAATPARVDVWPDGRVVLEARPDDSSSDLARYLSLSGISFLAG